MPTGSPRPVVRKPGAGALEGWRGWDEYAEFYDWENARTMGRRDLAFWTAFVSESKGRVLELGCGSGRVTGPLSRSGARMVGLDRSPAMLRLAVRRLKRRAPAARLLQGDVTALPFAVSSFDTVVAPYGILQSLLSDKALNQVLEGVVRVLAPGGRFGLELVPDVPRWREVDRRISLVGLDGPNHVPVTLVESVHHDRARRLTTFDHEFLEGTGKHLRTLRFTIRFRTLRLPTLVARLQRAGLVIDGLFGGYRGQPWSEDADTWLVLARKPRPRALTRRAPKASPRGS